MKAFVAPIKALATRPLRSLPPWAAFLLFLLPFAQNSKAFVLTSPAIQVWSDSIYWTASIYTAAGGSLTYPDTPPGDASTSYWDLSVDASVSGGPPAEVYAISDGTTVTDMTQIGDGLGGYVQGSLQFGSYVLVNTSYQIVNNPQTGTGADTVEFKYVVSNDGPGAAQVSFRLLIDTDVNSVDGANLSVNNGFSVVTQPTAYRQSDGDLPGNWWDYDIPPPGIANVVGRGSLFGNPYDDPATKPAVFEIAEWPTVSADNVWFICPTGSPINDSAAVLWWTGGSNENAPGYNLAPGASVTLITYYGLNQGTLLQTFTPVATASPTLTATPTFSVTPSNSASETITPTPSITPSPSLSPTSTVTSTWTPTAVPLLLTPHYPNPDPARDGDSVWLPYSISTGAFMTIEVYDVAGEVVRTWDAQDYEAVGTHERQWDLRNSSGKAVASGVYLARIHAEAGGQQQTAWEKCAVAR